MAPRCHINVELSAARVPVSQELEVEVPCIGHISDISAQLESLVTYEPAKLMMNFELLTPLAASDTLLVHIPSLNVTVAPMIHFELTGVDARTGATIAAYGNANWDDAHQVVLISTNISFAEARYNLTLEAAAEGWDIPGTGISGALKGWIALHSNTCPAPARPFQLAAVPVRSSSFSALPAQSGTAATLTLTVEFGMQVANGTLLEVSLPGFACVTSGELPQAVHMRSNSSIDTNALMASWNPQLSTLSLTFLRPWLQDSVIAIVISKEHGFTTPALGLLRHDIDFHPSLSMMLPDSSVVLNGRSFDSISSFGSVSFSRVWFDFAPELSANPTIWVSFSFTGRLQGGDVVHVALPGFWSTAFVESTNLTALAEWDACKQVVHFTLSNNVMMEPDSVLVLGVRGLHLPHVGVLSQSGVSIAIQSVDGAVAPQAVAQLQPIGRTIDSSWSVLPAHLQDGNEMHFSLRASVSLPEFSVLYLELPGFSIQGFNLTDCGAVPVSNATWDATRQIAYIEIFEAMRPGQVLDCHVTFANGYVLPLGGIVRGQAEPKLWATAGDELLLIHQSFANLTELGLLHANVEFGVVTVSDPIELTVSFKVSHVLLEGDFLAFHIPDLCRESGEISVVADNPLYSDFEIDWDADSGTLVFVAQATHPPRTTTAVITPSQGFQLCAETVKAEWWSAELQSDTIGTSVFNASASSGHLQSPEFVSAAQATLVFGEEDASFSLQVEMTFDDSHPSYEQDRSYTVELPGFSRDLSVNLEDFHMTVSSSDTAVEWVDQWLEERATLRDDALSAKGPSIFSSAKYLLAPVDATIGEIPVELPMWKSTAQSAVVQGIFVAGTSSRAETVVLGDTVTVAVQFSKDVYVQGCVRLWMNTDGFAVYSSGNGTTTLLFVYSVKHGDDVTDLAVDGPAALQSCGGQVISTIPGVPANTTISPPFGKLARQGGQMAELRIDSFERAEIIAISTTYGLGVAEEEAVLFAGDRIDLDVQFSRAILVSSAVTGTLPDLRLSLNGGAAEANLVPFVREFQVQVTCRDGVQFCGSLWQLDFGAAGLTDCMKANDPLDFAGAIRVLRDRAGLDLHISSVQPIAYGLSYVIRYNTLAGPLPAATPGGSNCAQRSPSATVHIQPTDLATRLMTFRYTAREGDHYESLNVTDISGLTTSGLGEALVMTDAALPSQPANLTLPAEERIYTRSGSAVRVSGTAPRVIRVVPSQLGPLTFNETVQLIVEFDQPVQIVATPGIVAGPPYLMLALNPGTANATFVGQTAAQLIFEYHVQSGDFANPLQYTSVAALQGNGTQIVRKGLIAYPAELQLPMAGSSGSLDVYGILVNFQLPARVLHVAVSVPAFSGEGDFVDVHVWFTSAVTVQGTPYVAGALCNRPVQLTYSTGSGSAALRFHTLIKVADDGCSHITLDATITTGDFVPSIVGLFQQPVDPTLPTTTFTLPYTLDTSPPMALFVNSSDPDGQYRVGDKLDIHIIFSKRVAIVAAEQWRSDSRLTPQLALFTPRHPNQFARYERGNMSTTLHFSFTVPAPDVSQTFSPVLHFDYAGVDSLFANLRGNRIMSGEGGGEVAAIVQLPVESDSYLRNSRHIDIAFENVVVVEVTSMTPDGVYTLGDTIEVNVRFDDAVVVFVPPPVLKLALANRVADAIYHGGNGTKTLHFQYKIEDGDTTEHLEYLDTTTLLPHYPQSFALSFDQRKQSTTNMLSPSPLDRHSGGVFRAAAPDVSVSVHLPAVGAQGSLSSRSHIVINTVPPVVVAVVAEQPSYVYRQGFELGIQIHFSEPLVVLGCPRLKMRSNLRGQYATFGPLPNLPDNVVRVAYSVPPGSDVSVLDYESEDALELVPCGTWQTQTFIRRKAAKLLLDADLRLPAVGPRKTVLSAPSISADGVQLQLTPSNVAAQHVIDVSDLAVHGPGSQLSLSVHFSSRVMSAAESWLGLYTNQGVWFARQQWLNSANTSLIYAVAPLPFQNDGRVQWADIFAIQPGSCVVKDSHGQCVSPVLPSQGLLANSEGVPITIDSKGPVMIKLSYSGKSVVEGDQLVRFSATFSHPIEVVGGMPELRLLVDEESQVSVRQWQLKSVYHYHDTLEFDFKIPSAILEGTVRMVSEHPLQLNGALIYRQSSFIMTQTAEVSAYCLARALPLLQVHTPRPSVRKVFARMDGVFQANDTVDIFVEFDEPIQIIDSPPTLQLFAGRPRNASCSEHSSNTAMLLCKYLVRSGDFTSDLDYSNREILVSSPMGIVSARKPSVSVDLRLPPHGARGSLARESDVVVAISPIKIEMIHGPAVTTPLSPGDTAHFVVMFSEPIVIMDGVVQLRLVLKDDDGADFRNAELQNADCTDCLHFIYTIRPADRTGNLSVDSLTAKLAAVNGSTPVSTTIYDNVRPAAVPVDTVAPQIIKVELAIGLFSSTQFSTEDQILIDVHFTKAVALNGTSNTYCLRLQLDHPSEPVCATYAQGTGTDRVQFMYIIQRGDSADVLKYDGREALQGEIWCSAEQLVQRANTTLPQPGSAGSLNFGPSIRVDTSTPFVSAIIPLTRRGTYVAGEDVIIMVRFSKPVVVEGSPTLSLRFDNGTGSASYLGDAASVGVDPRTDVFPTDILFKYTVEHAVESVDIVHDGPNALQVHNSSIYSLDRHGNISDIVDLTLREPGDFHLVKGQVRQQWISRFAAHIDVAVRDLHHSDGGGVTLHVAHRTASAVLVRERAHCDGLGFGKTWTSSHSRTVGADYLFADTRYPNIAATGTPSQSSVFGSAFATNAIDGDLGSEDSVSHTSGVHDFDPWWQLQFASPTAVSTVVVWLPVQHEVIPQIQHLVVWSSFREPTGMLELVIEHNQQTTTLPVDISVCASCTDANVSLQALLEGVFGSGQVSVSRHELRNIGKYGYRFEITVNAYENTQPFKYNNLTLSADTVVEVELIRPASKVITEAHLDVAAPMEILFFNASVQEVPSTLAEATKLAFLAMPIFREDGSSMRSRRDAIIAMPETVEVSAIRIQMRGAASLAIAEVQVYREQLQYFNTMPCHALVPSRPMTAAYQPEEPFSKTLQHVPFDGEWVLSIDTSPQMRQNGSVGDWVLMITDYSGLTEAYYMNLVVNVYTLPKYGRLASVSTITLGNFQQLFMEAAVTPLQVAPGMERPLGRCVLDPSTMECVDNFGVPPRLTTRRLGDIAIPQLLRQERLVRYTPKPGYLGQDQFTYRVVVASAKLSIPDMLVEVRVHVRNCRLHEYRQRMGNTLAKHAMCECQDSSTPEPGAIANCSAAVAATCADMTQVQVFPALCTICLSSRSMQGACLREIDRAARLVTSRGLCGDLGLPICETEVFTEPAPEPFIFAAQQDPYFASQVVSTGNNYGAEGALGTTGLA